MQFNLLSGKASFYGVHSWFWYISEGVPVVLTSYLLLLVPGVYRYLKMGQRWILFNAGVAIFVLSLSAHKEYRFLLPVMPSLILLCLYALPSNKFIKTLIFIQIPVFVYLGYFHQLGALKATDLLRNEDPSSVAFWVNCHGTPFYSHMHKNIPMSFLRCEPL